MVQLLSSLQTVVAGATSACDRLDLNSDTEVRVQYYPALLCLCVLCFRRKKIRIYFRRKFGHKSWRHQFLGRDSPTPTMNQNLVLSFAQDLVNADDDDERSAVIRAFYRGAPSVPDRALFWREVALLPGGGEVIAMMHEREIGSQSRASGLPAGRGRFPPGRASRARVPAAPQSWRGRR